MALLIVQWWTAYFLAGWALGLLCFSLMMILLSIAVVVNGSRFLNEMIVDRSGNIITALTIGGITLTIICVFFATYTLFLENSDKGLRGIQPFRFRSFLQWLVKGLAYSTNPSTALNDFIGFRRK